MVKVSVILVLLGCVTVIYSVKMTPQMEKCGEQLLMTLAKEKNKEMKGIMNKGIKLVQSGDLKASQDIFKNLSPDQKKISDEIYWVKDCAVMKGCLECPIEL